MSAPNKLPSVKFESQLPTRRPSAPSPKEDQSASERALPGPALTNQYTLLHSGSPCDATVALRRGMASPSNPNAPTPLSIPPVQLSSTSEEDHAATGPGSLIQSSSPTPTVLYSEPDSASTSQSDTTRVLESSPSSPQTAIRNPPHILARQSVYSLTPHPRPLLPNLQRTTLRLTASLSTPNLTALIESQVKLVSIIYNLNLSLDQIVQIRERIQAVLLRRDMGDRLDEILAKINTALFRYEMDRRLDEMDELLTKIKTQLLQPGQPTAWRHLFPRACYWITIFGITFARFFASRELFFLSSIVLIPVMIMGLFML